LVTIKKFDPNPILVNINKLKIYRTPDVASQKVEATTKGGRNNLMAIPHQNLVLEYISNDQHKINIVEKFDKMVMEFLNDI
jgi:hypothetical protein